MMEMIMSPYEIKLLLDIYSIVTWCDERSEPILCETLDKFERTGLIEWGACMGNAKLTSKGRAHVSQLCNLPFPQELKQWVDHAGSVILNL
jgi:hypothetical protein